MTRSTPLQDPDDLLPALRELHETTLGREVQEALRGLEQSQRRNFVAERMRLAAAVLSLETAALSELRLQFEQQSRALNEGIVELTEALGELERAEEWAQGLGKLLSTVSSFLRLPKDLN